MNATNSSTAPDTRPSEGVRRFNFTRQPSIMEIADAEKYENYTTRVRFDDRFGALEIDKDRDPGSIWRFGVALRIVPWRREFALYVRAGANASDLDHAETIVQHIREGHFADIPWHADSKSRGEFFTVWLGRDTTMPNPREDDRLATPCNESDCIATYHLQQDAADPVTHRGNEVVGEWWTIALEKASNEPLWTLYLDVREDAWTSAQVTSFANDLRWAAADCDKLNAVVSVS